MAKTIAIVTGAAGGIGKEFVSELNKEALDEIWIIGRNKERLGKMKEQYGEKIVPLCADLTNKQDLLLIKDLLTEKYVISYLINNAGIAHMMPSKDFDADEIEKTILTNCNAPAVLTNYCIPYMKKGGKHRHAL